MSQPTTIRKLSADAPPFVPQNIYIAPKLNANAKAFVPSSVLKVEPIKEDKKESLPVPFLPEAKPKEEVPKKEESKETKEAARKKLFYDRAYLYTFKEKCKKRPFHMKEINIPLNKWSPPAIDDQRIKNIKEIRSMLNKFAKANYMEYTKQIVAKEYSPEELSELAKILFNKSVKESLYVEYYMELCDQMMKKYKGKEPNFRKLFISKCQSLFEETKQNEYDSTLKDVDEDERKEKSKTRLLNNIILIGELFVRGALTESILQSIIERMLKEKTESSVENLCKIFSKIGETVYTAFAYQQEQTSKKKKPSIKLKAITKEIFDEYIDKLIEFKNDEKISSRIKIAIQDIIDARDDKWVKAFDEFVVKENSNNKVVFIPKQHTKEEEKQPPKLDSIDPKVLQRENLKKSLNEVSVLGIGLEPFTNVKLDETSRLKAQNTLDEYLVNKSIKEVKSSLEGQSIVMHIWIGYFFLYADTMSKKDSAAILTMIIELLRTKTITKEELLKGIMVHVANLYDSLIDNPLCEKYLEDFFEKLIGESIYDKESIGKLREHVATIKKKLEEDYKS